MLAEKKNEKRNFLDLEQLRIEVFNGCVSKTHIYNCVKRGEIPSVSIGGRLLVPMTYVNDIMSKTERSV